jgi:methionyl-tRNA synthetase
MNDSYYISTAIHYVNDVPHLGHMYEDVVADVVARFQRLQGKEVFFLTGTDEHGIKMERAAAAAGIQPIELADRIAGVHKQLWRDLGIDYDDFIRTTQPRHRTAVYALLERIRERNPGDIYLGEHRAWYCANEETFVPNSQVREGRCENGHGVEMASEQNYFFRLSNYEQRLCDFYEQHPDFVRPRTRFNEVYSFVRAGLRDLSISRTAVKWGIPFPGDPAHVIYVWFDALTNYISALGFGGDDERFQKFWPADVHLVGKDIVRFHAVYWPAFLMAAGLEPPKAIVGHGWWLSGEQKMSKSEGNVVGPRELIDRFGAEASRYLLMREIVFGQDAAFSLERFETTYTAELANDIGNTTSRVLTMVETKCGGRCAPPAIAHPLRESVEFAVPAYLSSMKSFDFTRSLEAIRNVVRVVNAFVTETKPWVSSGAEAAELLSPCVEALRCVWLMLIPFVPVTGREALNRIGVRHDKTTFAELRWGAIPQPDRVQSGTPLFPRLKRASAPADDLRDSCNVAEGAHRIR